MDSRIILAVCAASVALGCSSGGVTEPEASQSAASAVTDATRFLPGYTHNLSLSHFRIGQNTALERNDSRVQRWRGTLGAFTVDPTNGSACAALDAKSPTGPYILDEATHSSKVKSYFIGAGIPENQMGEIQATYESEPETVSASATEALPPFRLRSVTSIVRRRVSGVLVAESEAWAKMTVNGDVESECVFWPTLDMATVNKAVSWSKALADGAAHKAYLAKLPGAVRRDGGVVIHHTDASIHSAPVTYVSYDAVVDAAGSAPARHFDENGVEFKLPQELDTTPKASPATVRR